ncbi:hypothetical protein EBR78_04855 [bacterium]|nr:hypothetical protein [bacterium]
MKPIAPMITAPEGVIELANELAKVPVFALDTEFIRETSFFPRIALIQIATAEKVWLIDPTVLSKSELMPLIQNLVDPKILKVLHASHADQECFFWSYDVVANPVLDTSVAAALCGMGDSIGLQKLLREVLGVHVSKGRARAKWLNRPLSNELLHYAEQDVAHLVRLGEELRERLETLGRWEWALEESLIDPHQFEVSPEEMAMKIAKGAHLHQEESVLAELIRWRESRARDANLPRGWIADNEVLVALARSQPQSLEELKTFRGIHAKEIERSGKKILEAIAEGKLKSKPRLQPDKREIIRVDPYAADLIQTYIYFLAGKHKIMPRYLMNQHQAHQLLSHPELSKEEWVSIGALTPRAAELIGDDLVDFFHGKKALRIINKRLAIVDLDPT